MTAYHRMGMWQPALLLVMASLVWGIQAPLAAPRGQDAWLADLAEGMLGERRDALRWLALHGNQGAAAAIVASLRDDDELVRNMAESALWAIWSRSGNNGADEMLKMGTYLMVNGKVEESVELFNRVISEEPEFAEGYNKRATAYYLLGAYRRSLKDIDLTLARNPYHFGALSGAGYCMLRLERLEEAEEYLQRALSINPNMEGVRELTEGIRKKLGKRAI